MFIVESGELRPWPDDSPFAAVRDDPDDWDARQVLADWIEESPRLLWPPARFVRDTSRFEADAEDEYHRLSEACSCAECLLYKPHRAFLRSDHFAQLRNIYHRRTALGPLQLWKQTLDDVPIPDRPDPTTPPTELANFFAKLSALCWHGGFPDTAHVPFTFLAENGPEPGPGRLAFLQSLRWYAPVRRLFVYANDQLTHSYVFDPWQALVVASGFRIPEIVFVGDNVFLPPRDPLFTDFPRRVRFAVKPPTWSSWLNWCDKNNVALSTINLFSYWSQY